MDLTPEEIAEKEFDKSFALWSYDDQEVEEFLELVSIVYEEALVENKKLKEKMEDLKSTLAEEEQKIEDEKQEAAKIKEEAQKEAEKIVEKPEDAEYPFWAAADPETALSGGGGVLLKLKVPEERIIFFDKKKWNQILNLSYIADNQKDLNQHRDNLKKLGITDDSEVMLSPHYPVLKNKIKQSWQKLFEAKNDGFNPKRKGAALWELRSRWVEEVIENK